MRLYPTHIILECIEFSRATPHEVLIPPKREGENAWDTYLFTYFVPLWKGQMHWKLHQNPISTQMNGQSDLISVDLMFSSGDLTSPARSLDSSKLHTRRKRDGKKVKRRKQDSSCRSRPPLADNSFLAHEIWYQNLCTRLSSCSILPSFSLSSFPICSADRCRNFNVFGNDRLELLWEMETGDRARRAGGRSGKNTQTNERQWRRASSDSSVLGFECRLVKVGFWRWGNSEDDVVACMYVQYV
jgi:hypothetical protein